MPPTASATPSAIRSVRISRSFSIPLEFSLINETQAGSGPTKKCESALGTYSIWQSSPARSDVCPHQQRTSITPAHPDGRGGHERLEEFLFRAQPRAEGRVYEVLSVLGSQRNASTNVPFSRQGVSG